MVLGFKEKFPDNSPTDFVEAILDGRKKHSIRKGCRWRKGMVIHMATGVRTKNYRLFNQDQVFSTEPITIFPKTKEVFVGIRKLSDQEIEILAKNDHLTVERFWEWFGKDETLMGQIIHWTDLKYEKRDISSITEIEASGLWDAVMPAYAKPFEGGVYRHKATDEAPERMVLMSGVERLGVYFNGKIWADSDMSPIKLDQEKVKEYLQNIGIFVP